jgi:hypothetical protein
MVCKDGSSTVLKDVLYVPELRVILLSARRMCRHGMKGEFDEHEMLFKLNGQTIIKATMTEGLYIVTQIAKGYQDTAFTADTNGAEHITTEIAPLTGDECTRTSGTSSRELALSAHHESQYQLMHRRFNHLGPDKIRNLHKVTTMSTPIKIPSETETCTVCALTKMTNRIPRKVSDHKDEMLTLIHFDIAGPFPMSIRGNQYFLLIIDSYTRKNWIIILKNKSGAIESLKIWKRDVEFETSKKRQCTGVAQSNCRMERCRSWNALRTDNCRTISPKRTC